VSPNETGLARIKSEAVRFRRAFEKCDPNRLPDTLKQFPRGACGDAVLLLAEFLGEQGIGIRTFTYVCGERQGARIREFHTWLEIDGVIVDITADQFPEITETVIVTRHSAWHRTFKHRERKNADYRIYGEPTISTLGNAYNAIFNELDR
jgi:hypothetical protein